jgi:hypothetical protein
MKALKWLVLCLALPMAACQPADEETSNEQNCMGEKAREIACDELYDAAFQEWKYCLEQGAENEMMLDALEVIRSMCIFDADCIDPAMMDSCLDNDGFTCAVNMGDISISYACGVVLGLH